MSSSNVSPSSTPAGVQARNSSIGSTSPTDSIKMPGSTLIPNRIFVGGISTNTTEQDLKTFFSTYGAVKDSKVISDAGGVSKGYGFVTFETIEDAENVIQHKGGDIIFKERKLNIAPAFRKQQPYPKTYGDGQSILVTDPNFGISYLTGGLPVQNGGYFMVPDSTYMAAASQTAVAASPGQAAVPYNQGVTQQQYYVAAQPNLAYYPSSVAQSPQQYTRNYPTSYVQQQTPTPAMGGNLAYVYPSSPELMYAQAAPQTNVPGATFPTPPGTTSEMAPASMTGAGDGGVMEATPEVGGLAQPITCSTTCDTSVVAMTSPIPISTDSANLGGVSAGVSQQQRTLAVSALPSPARNAPASTSANTANLINCVNSTQQSRNGSITPQLPSTPNAAKVLANPQQPRGMAIPTMTQPSVAGINVNSTQSTAAQPMVVSPTANTLPLTQAAFYTPQQPYSAINQQHPQFYIRPPHY